jgi:hypothetical protein
MKIPVVWAAEEINIRPSGQFGKLGDITIPALVAAVIKFALIIAALIAFAFLIIGGIKWILSGGDKDAMGKAQGSITSALVGLIVVFAAWAIIRLIEVFFGISILTLTIPTV